MFAKIDDIEDLPTVAGAYALVIHLNMDMKPPIKSLGPFALPQGRYLYAGSANGPGGLKAHLKRHLKASKKIHWHVDHLTEAAGVHSILAMPGQNECRIRGVIQRQPGVRVPVPGFGSTDCPLCPSHLLALPDELDPFPVLEDLGKGVTWFLPPPASFRLP